MRRVALVGAGVSNFGVRKASYRDLICEAGKACFDSIPAVMPKDVEGLVVGSVMPERTAFQSHIASLAAEALGIKPSALSARTEHMCASGTVGIRYAYAFIAAGLADLVMVLGVEKLAHPWPTRPSSTWGPAWTASGRPRSVSPPRPSSPSPARRPWPSSAPPRSRSRWLA